MLTVHPQARPLPRKRLPKPDAINLKTRERILQTAFEMFGRYGYDGVSIGQLSEACDLTRGALYWYFIGKEALFVECVKRLRKLFVAHIYAPMVRASNPKEQMLKFFQGIESVLNDSENLESVSGLLIGIGRVDRDLIKEFRTRARRDAEHFLANILENGRKSGQFRFIGDALPIARTLFVAMEGCLAQARVATVDQTTETVQGFARWFFLAYSADSPAGPGLQPALLQPACLS
ncbi:MAG: TetR/AcrR family transcriptional regulator [Candidatus Macondimonas sp.]